MKHLASLEVARALRAMRLPVPTLLLSLLTSGCTGCSCPEGATTIYPVDLDTYEDLLARYGADGVPIEVCEVICRSSSDLPEGGLGGTGGVGGTGGLGGLGGTGGVGGTGGLMGSGGAGGLEAAGGATTPAPTQSSTIASCKLVSIELDKGGAQCTLYNDCGGAGRPSHRVGPARAASHLFAETARLEAASVVAFLDLAKELQAHGLPSALSSWARRCAREEAGHARAFASLARRASAQIAPLELSTPFQVRSLEAIAVDNAREGLASELVGALRLCAQTASAPRALRKTLARIASEEASHAGFSIALDRYLRPKLDRAARARVREARREQMDRLRLAAELEPPRWQRERAGVPAAEVAQDLVRAAEGIADRVGV